MFGLLRVLVGVDIVRKRWVALLITFSVAHACALKGFDYLQQYPGWLGWLLCALSPLTALVVGTNLLALTSRDQGTASAHRSDTPDSAPAQRQQRAGCITATAHR